MNPLRERLLIGEEERIALHGNAEPLSQDVIPGCRCNLRSLNIIRVGLIRDSFTDVRLGLNPHAWILDLFNVIQPVVPNGDVVRRRFLAEVLIQLHFD